LLWKIEKFYFHFRGAYSLPELRTGEGGVEVEDHVVQQTLP
jgi:hypothetical protein